SLFALTLSLMGFSHAAEQAHKIPDAPPEYLAKTNPLADTNDEALLKRANRLFRGKCVKCHGEEGDGKGPRAESLIIKPAAFGSPGYLNGRKDGQLFWIISFGSPGTDMPAHGPGTDINLSEEEIWSIITYLRRNLTR
ncbi:MAG: c-type cytochrome, partial [Magnetococcales bacterium]|nr:c-type cytochrome [Magnetococcales bacterium]